MNASRDIAIVIGLFILLFFLWLASGGPARSENRSERSSNGVFSFALPTFSIAQPSTNYSGNNTVDESTPVPEEGVHDPGSVYEGVVSISSVTRSGDPEREQIRLRVSSGYRGEPISVTGWRLTSRITGRSVTIPEATELLKLGAQNTTGPILLESGDTVIISSGRSPIGLSFQTNICTGYLEQYQDFSPSLERRCPYPSFEDSLYSDPAAADDDCLDFIERIPRCSLITNFPDSLSRTCRDYVRDHFSYHACIAEYKDAGPDFYRGSWYVYLTRTEPLWKTRREAISLVDSDGGVVDTYTY